MKIEQISIQAKNDLKWNENLTNSDIFVTLIKNFCQILNFFENFYFFNSFQEIAENPRFVIDDRIQYDIVPGQLGTNKN